jgi:hypothetical protein
MQNKENYMSRIVYEYEDMAYIYVHKHFCPCCSRKLKVVKRSKTVDPNSPEAENYDLAPIVKTRWSKPVAKTKFIWDEFECPACKKSLTEEEMKEIEGITEENTTEEYEKAKRIYNTLKFFCVMILIAIVLGIATLIKQWI